MRNEADRGTDKNWNSINSARKADTRTRNKHAFSSFSTYLLLPVYTQGLQVRPLLMFKGVVWLEQTEQKRWVGSWGGYSMSLPAPRRFETELTSFCGNTVLTQFCGTCYYYKSSGDLLTSKTRGVTLYGSTSTTGFVSTSPSKPSHNMNPQCLPGKTCAGGSVVGRGCLPNCCP